VESRELGVLVCDFVSPHISNESCLSVDHRKHPERVLTHKNFLGTVEKAFQKEIIRLLAFATHPHLSSSHAQQSKPAESMVRYEALALGIILSIDAADACSCPPDFWEKTMCERAQDHDLVVHGTAVNRFVCGLRSIVETTVFLASAPPVHITQPSFF